MPRLKKYASGRGYYLSGHVPKVGFCTWQIKKEGQDYLAARGISSSGDFVRLEDVKTLIDLKLIYTAHGGTDPTPGESCPEWVPALSDRLVAWAPDGGIETLSRVVCPGEGAAADCRPYCFPGSFLDWACELDPDAGPARLAEVTASEFEGIAADELDKLDTEPLFKHVLDRGAIEVVWRLVRVIGLVSLQLRTRPDCPEEWERRPLLRWIFARLKDRAARGSAGRPAGSRRGASWSSPFLVWEVDPQQVIAVFPGQSLPVGVTGVAWRIGQQPPVYPLVRPGKERQAIEESISRHLPPAESYPFELSPIGGAGERVRWVFGCPAESPVLLFHTDGRLVDCEEPDPLPAGRYMGLVRGAMQGARGLTGVTLAEPVPVGPMGWHGWSGYYLELSPGAEIPGYRVAAEAVALRWEAESPPDVGVRWLESSPVFVGKLPQVTVEPAGAFRGASLEVQVEGAPGSEGRSFYLTVGKEVSLLEKNGQGALDLSSFPPLKDCFGRFRLRCRFPNRPEHPALALGFNRLPPVTLKYVPDPRRHGVATAVLLTGAAVTLDGMTAGQDTELIPGQPGRPELAEIVLRSTRPESAPGVIARHSTGGWEIRVRIEVSRGCLLGGGHAFGGWVPLPVPGIDLSAVGLDDRLRLEFLDPPVVEGGRLVSRLPGRDPLFVGEPLDPSPRPRVFQVDLHRWRDGFGVGSSGLIQVRGPSGWLPVADLEASHPGPLDHRPESVGGGSEALPEPPDPGWKNLTVELDEAVRLNDPVSASSLIERCLLEASGPEASPCAADLLPTAAARAALAILPPAAWDGVRAAVVQLATREDLPDAKLIAARFEIRDGRPLNRNAEWSHSRLDELKDRLPRMPESEVVLAEAWYQLARSAAAPAGGCWRSCFELCDHYLHRSRETGLAFSEAWMLRELARLMSRADPESGPVPGELLPSHQGWVDAIRLASRFVRQSWDGRARNTGYPQLSGPAPSVLRREDVTLIRFITGLAAGEAEAQWPAVRELDAGCFYAMPLLRARYARYTGNQADAEGEYNRAWAAFLADESYDLLDIIAAERP